MMDYAQATSRRVGRGITSKAYIILKYFFALGLRCGQPGQQQGLLFPLSKSARNRSICSLLVSGFLKNVIQQIHSLRASGVISSHAASALGAEVRAFCKSAGTLCTTPALISFEGLRIVIIIFVNL